MRKRWVWGLICLLLCLLPACGQEKPAANDVPPASESPVEAAPQKREADFQRRLEGFRAVRFSMTRELVNGPFTRRRCAGSGCPPALPSRLSPPSWAFTQGFCPDRRAP